MSRFSPGRVALAAALLAAIGSSPVMAQTATGSGPGNTQLGTYTGPQQPTQTSPIELYLGYGEVYSGTAAGNGSASSGVGTNSSGQINSVGASTQLPGDLCAESGEDVTILCQP